MIVGIRRRVSVMQLNEVEGRCVVPGIVFAFAFVFSSKWGSELVMYSIHDIPAVLVCISVCIGVVGVGVEDLIHSLVE